MMRALGKQKKRAKRMLASRRCLPGSPIFRCASR